MNMPRQARVKGEYCIYHIIQRGNERKDIFFSDKDRERYLEIVRRMKDRYNFVMYAYCLMTNHTHLLINDNGNDISKIIQSINISYVQYINRCYRRCGHLFQDRFKSEIVDNDSYLLQVSKYIHNNPVKAGLIREPRQYKWSSYTAYIGRNQDTNRFCEPERVLQLVSDKANKAKEGYIEYMGVEERGLNIMDIEETPIVNGTNTKLITNIIDGYKWLDNTASERNSTVKEMLLNKKVRNDEIKRLKKNSSLSLKEIGELFGGLSESRVCRVVAEE
jgi:REP element-mobilizing transposase RayT